MSGLEERVQRLERLLGQVFRPGGTIAIRDDEHEAATILIGDAKGDLGAVLMSFGLSVKEPADDRRIVVTAAGVGLKDERDVLRLFLGEMGVLFLNEAGEPVTLISSEGVLKVSEGGAPLSSPSL
jgi:hypothetical protein